MNRPDFIDLGPVQMVPGATPTIPLIRLEDLTPKAHALAVGQTTDGYRYGELSEAETRKRLAGLGFTDPSLERVIDFCNRRRAARVAK